MSATEPTRLGKNKTSALIRTLAQQAGSPAAEGRPIGGFRFSLAMPVAVVLAIMAALVVVITVIGPRPDLDSNFFTWMFQFKLALTLLAAFGTGLLARNAAIAGARITIIPMLLPAAALMLAGILFDSSGFPLLGIHTLSAPRCLVSIVIASLPALGLILAAMRRGIPTRPAFAGGLAGALAGSLGAMAYAIACVNDGTSFVAVWYTSAIAIVALIGAAIGARALAW
ncbi:NrsF family protein [Rhizobium panacihumi]|uniref:NrsF family protein n=1 Tax=Rhizobium panacihumi TaxID=2008450 RepID=UPI003D7A4008